MSLYKDEAIVLFKRAFGESDKIIRLFTHKSGKIAAIAKGGSKSQKRFMNTLELFNCINVEYFEKTGKGLVRLENAYILEANHGIEENIKKVCTAGFFTELVDRLKKERERHDELFYLLKDILKTLKQAEFNYTDIVYNHMKILETLGFMPNLTECVYCGNKMDVEEKVCFSSEKGGVLCRACSSALPHKTYNEGVIERILLFCKGRGERDYRLTDRVMDEGISSKKESKGYVFLERQIQDIMEGFMSYHLDVELRSYRLLKRYVFKQ